MPRGESFIQARTVDGIGPVDGSFDAGGNFTDHSGDGGQTIGADGSVHNVYSPTGTISSVEHNTGEQGRPAHTDYVGYSGSVSDIQSESDAGSPPRLEDDVTSTFQTPGGTVVNHVSAGARIRKLTQGGDMGDIHF